MQLYPNASILVQIAIFVVVWMGLRRLAFEPMQRALDERERRTVHAERSAEAMVAAAAADRAQYELAVHERRLQMAQEAERARHAAIEESNRQIAAARAAIGRDLAAQRATVAAQVDSARRQLATEADAIAAQMLLGVTRGART
jgi:F0F1-type ATP synthase membrane subunit b/b'